MTRRFLLLALVLLYLLHNDLWWWDDPSLVLGVPVGLGYHIGFCLVVSVVMFLLLRFAPPEDLWEESRSGVDHGDDTEPSQ